MSKGGSETNLLRIEVLEGQHLFVRENTSGEATLVISVEKEKKKIKINRKDNPIPGTPNNKIEIGKIPMGEHEIHFLFTDAEKKQPAKHYRCSVPMTELLPYNTNHVKELEFKNEANAEDEQKPIFKISMFLFQQRDTKADKAILKKAGALLIATNNSDLMLIMSALELPKIDVNMCDKEEKNTALHIATMKSTNEHILLTLLKDPRIDVNVKNKDDNTPLHYFCLNFSNPNCEEAFSLFQQRSANMNAKNKIGETPLHKAVFNKCIRLILVELLLKAGAEVDATTKNGSTAMHYAMYMERTDLISILLENNASMEIKNEKGETPLSIVSKSKNQSFQNTVKYFKEVIEYLKGINADTQEIKMFIHNRLFKWKLKEITAKQLDKIGIKAIGRQRELMKEFKKIEDIDPAKLSDKSTQIESEEKEREKLLNNILSSSKFLYKVEYTELIGTGTSGKVFKGILEGKIDVAVKTLKAGSLKEVEEFQHEFGVLSKLDHTNIVKFFGVFQDEHQKMMMVMEYCDRGSLYDVLSKGDLKMKFETLFDFSEQIAKGLEYLHNKNILHRDLKSLNILVQTKVNEKGQEHLVLKICDFGLSRFNSTDNLNTLQKLRGTYAYCAPEIYFSQPFTYKSDIFSYGIILWEMTYRTIHQKYQRPYQEFPDIKLDVQIILKSATLNLRPTIPASTPLSLTNLIKQCIIKEQDGRPSSSDILMDINKMKKEYESNPSAWDTCIISN
ncbi:protein kinase, putative [Entamoeba histolytica HM-3:IMSS]|uniref:Protein kinase, putative n=6 Tax=Entamoeba histolytica TaxID=5759 RepID=C4LVX8_ENTH1|nr:protein kinase, putative [Entamoeba histolytica HM-1:IMSS]EMD42407.1 protein kinase, putative [Entamoeba histolytica KU27]EMS14144.1 protein kinase, putative [Entamoeba histolytica HM-3:IMSS]ENY61627.1 protein kinase, putative [Entamoeba histolytica HM-1:IMSS-A]GAT92837.1 protein kinase putative [Entamoeba histolytica]EAL47634.2 protein kinase, putative [Entamoeba histolytica HM-1:IMSS]|eukprot:XP_653020.2 protein kinase, putative [Entamoeba histolytica HM-1:IMSS]